MGSRGPETSLSCRVLSSHKALGQTPVQAGVVAHTLGPSSFEAEAEAGDLYFCVQGQPGLLKETLSQTTQQQHNTTITTTTTQTNPSTTDIKEEGMLLHHWQGRRSFPVSKYIALTHWLSLRLSTCSPRLTDVRADRPHRCSWHPDR